VQTTGPKEAGKWQLVFASYNENLQNFSIADYCLRRKSE
jgi:hypothetical protein